MPNPPTVPTNNNEDGTCEDENDPLLILIGQIIERLAAQTAPLQINLGDDIGTVYNEQVSISDNRELPEA